MLAIKIIRVRRFYLGVRLKAMVMEELLRRERKGVFIPVPVTDQKLSLSAKAGWFVCFELDCVYFFCIFIILPEGNNSDFL